MILQLFVHNTSFNIGPPLWRIVDDRSTVRKIDKATPYQKPSLAGADEVFTVWPLGRGLRNCVVSFCISQLDASKFILLSYNTDPSAVDFAKGPGNYLAGFYNSQNKVYLKQLNQAFIVNNY